MFVSNKENQSFKKEKEKNNNFIWWIKHRILAVQFIIPRFPVQLLQVATYFLFFFLFF